jgi:hypothetical protein
VLAPHCQRLASWYAIAPKGGGETQAIFSSERLVCSVLHCLFLLVYQSGNVQAVTTLDHAFPARRPAISVEGRNARVAACVHEVARASRGRHRG